MADPADMDMLRAMLRDYGSQPAPDQNPLDMERINAAAGGLNYAMPDQERVNRPPAWSGIDHTAEPMPTTYTIPEAPGSSYGSIPELLAARARMEAMQQQAGQQSQFEDLVDKLQRMGGRVGEVQAPDPNAVNWR